ncbi:MAG: hypothetical protein ACP5D1_13415 [Bacteroidales bacterium]
MKKSFAILFIIILSMAKGIAQEPVFNKNDKVAQFNIGMGSALYTGMNYKTSVPPLSLFLEYGIADELIGKGSAGAGPFVGYAAYKWDLVDFGWKYSNMILGAKGNFHYPLIFDLDTYTGVIMGYNITSVKEFGSVLPGYEAEAAAGGFVWSWFVGARYEVMENFSLSAELGYGISFLNVGLAWEL